MMIGSDPEFKKCSVPECPLLSLYDGTCEYHRGSRPAPTPPIESIPNGEFVVKDSGERRVFETGAQRDTGEAKGLFHLIPYYPLERLAQLYEAGAIKYGKNNWRKGVPCSVFANSAARHLLKLLDGYQDEDHAAQAMWNVIGYIWTEHEAREGRLPANLLDMPHQETK